MPKNVQMPDGSVIEFPDTMDDGAISSVLQKQYSKTNSPIPQNVAGLPPGQAPPGLPGAPPVNMQPSPVGQIFGDPSTYGMVPLRHAGNMVKGVAGLAATPQNYGELAASVLGPATLPAYRALVAPSIQPAKEAINYAKQGQWDNARKSAINAVPIAGPWGQAVENEAQTSGGVPAALGMATDIAVPEIGSAFAPGIGAAVGGKLKGAGEGIINNTIGVLKKDVSRGQNPGAGYFQAGFGPSASMGSIASKAKGALDTTGEALGNAYQKADAAGTLIPADTVRSAIMPPVQNAIDTEMGPGGTMDPGQYIKLSQSYDPMLQAGDEAGGIKPSDVFSAKKNVARNTSWSDPTQLGLKSVRQQQVGKLSGVLSNAVPEVAPLNDQYANLASLTNRATDRAASPSYGSPMGHIAKIGAGATGGMLMGHASPYAAAGGVALSELADTVPARTTLASGLYNAGKIASGGGEALGKLQGTSYLFPPKKKR